MLTSIKAYFFSTELSRLNFSSTKLLLSSFAS